MATIHTARAHAQDAIHYAAFLLPGHCTDGRESTFVSERGLTRTMARTRMVEKLAMAGITVRTAKPIDAVIAIDAWANAQGWDAWSDCPLVDA